MWLLPFLLYAETHYRFPYFFSYLKKDEPEIVADAPYRIEPGNEIPVLVLVKDSHRYPCTLHQITVTISRIGTPAVRCLLLTRPVVIKKKWWWSIYRIASEPLKGWINLDVEIDIEVENVRRIYHNDNYRTSSRSPLKVYLAEVPLPRLPGLCFGDVHVHSYYTDDQVEYGAPPDAAVIFSKAMGLSFFGITDHSYDLDDDVGNYLQNDPSLPKWRSLRREISFLNRRYRNHKILLGEELSCRNVRGENVHLLLYGNRQFIPGSGDSAERWFRTRSDFSIVEVLHNLTDAIAAAAHPKEQVPLLQKLLLRRGTWTQADLRMIGISGMQFLNGDVLNGFKRGKHEWTNLLLAGLRIHAVAGNDAHGNFNRFRQIGFPFFAIAEHHRQIFGKMRTGLFLFARLSEKSIQSAIGRGNGIISDGPVATIHATNDLGEKASLGENIEGKRLMIHLLAESSREFGILRCVRLFLGLLGNNGEELLLKTNDIGQFKFDQVFSLEIMQAAYLRLEVETCPTNSFDNSPHFCFTNPIWCNPLATSK